MKISYAILTHNEGNYISNLLEELISSILSGTSAEIVILDDFSDDEYTCRILKEYNDQYPFIHVDYKKHTGDFSEQKNALTKLCKGDWIFNIDADEQVTAHLLSIVPLIVESNPDVEAYWLPRINTVEGLTLRHIQKWRWMVSTIDTFKKIRQVDKEEYDFLKKFDLIVEEHENGLVTYKEPIIMWPDPQMRLYKNNGKIHWTKPVHEVLTGYLHYSNFPYEFDYAIQHFKTIERQEQQNNFYESLQ